MTEKLRLAELNIEHLADMKPFILIVDDDMTVTWASDTVLRHFDSIVGCDLGEHVELKTLFGSLERASIVQHAGRTFRFLLKSNDEHLPLIGHWIVGSRELVLLAEPDISDHGNMDYFEFNDFAENDPRLDLFTLREEHETSLKEAKSAANILREMKLNLESVFSTVAEGLMVIDAEGRITMANPTALKMFNMVKKDDRELNLLDLDLSLITQNGTVLPVQDNPVSVSITTGQKCQNRILGRRDADGNASWFNVNTAPLNDSGGRLISVVMSITDITDRINAEEKLKKSLLEANRLNRLMMGREERVLEMKREVNTLLNELGREQKYLKR